MMATLYKYPPDKDNPGKVSEGTARAMRNQAEASHKGSQAYAIHKITTMTDRLDQSTTKRNARRRKRQRRTGKRS